MLVDSPLPRDYRLHCKLFTDEKLQEQYLRHSFGALMGCKTSTACFKEVNRELLRRSTEEYKLRKAELKQRQDDRRALKHARRAK